MNQLLSILAEQAKAAAFVRLRELQAAIEESAPAEQLRDAFFGRVQQRDLNALRKVVAALRGTARHAFVSLCVGHVLEQHARPAGDAAPIPATRTAAGAARTRCCYPAQIAYRPNARPLKRLTPRYRP